MDLKNQGKQPFPDADTAWREKMLLSDVVDIIPGLPFRARVETEPTAKYFVIQARDLGADGRVRITSAARLNALPARSADAFLQVRDVLFQPRGTRFFAATFDPPQRTPAVAAAPLLVLRADKARVVPEFLVAVLMSPTIQAELRQAAAGTYVPQVPRQAIQSLRIDLPTVESQITLAELTDLERRERELTERLREARGRLFDLAVMEATKKARKRADATGLKPGGAGAPAFRFMQQ